jgi:hypothetical protein
MNLNPLSREANAKTSVKKYFIDALGSSVTFDTSLASPDLRVQGISAVQQWYNIEFGEFGRSELNEYLFDAYMLSRQDPEGVKLAEITDVMMDLLVDSTKTDGMKRIPLYDISLTPWSQIASMVVQDIWDAPILDTVEDETKIKILSVRLRWGAAM